MARVGPRWRHRGILHRPGRGQMAPQRVVGRVGGLRPTAAWAKRAVCSRPAPLNDRHASVLALKSTCNEPWPVWTDHG